MKNLKSFLLKLLLVNLCIFIVFFLIVFNHKPDESKKTEVKKVEKEKIKAKITMVVGRAEVINSGHTKPARIGMILGEKAQITTYGGTVDMKIKGLGIFKMKPNSVLKLSSLSKKVKFKLNPGKILLVLKKLGKNSSFTSFDVLTPTAVIGVRGTSLLISAKEKSTKVGVLTGKVLVKSGKKSVAVGELKQVSVAGDEIKKVSKMDVKTIIDVREVLKIKDIDTMSEYKKIKLNIKKLEIIETGQSESELDLQGLKGSIKAKEVEDKGTTTKEELKKKSEKMDIDTIIESEKKQFVDDGEF